jgi:hypothetical protein
MREEGQFLTDTGMDTTSTQKRKKEMEIDSQTERERTAVKKLLCRGRATENKMAGRKQQYKYTLPNMQQN